MGPRLLVSSLVLLCGTSAAGCVIAEDDGYHAELYEQLGEADIRLGDAVDLAREWVPEAFPVRASFSPGLVRGSFEVRMFDDFDASVVLVRFDADGDLRDPWRRPASFDEADDAVVLAEGEVDLEQAILTAEDEVPYSEAFEVLVLGSRIEVGVVTSSAIYTVEISPTSGRVLDVDREVQWIHYCDPLHC